MTSLKWAPGTGVVVDVVREQVAAEGPDEPASARSSVKRRGTAPLDETAATVAVEQRVTGVVRAAAAAGRVTATAQAQSLLDDAHSAQVRGSLLAINQIGRLGRTLQAAGVRSLIVKGPALAAQTTGDFTSRTSGDIDLLIDPSDVRVAMQALLDAGVPRADDFAPGPDSPLFAHAVDVIQEAMFHIDGREVDLHWRLDIARGCLPWSFDELWERRDSLVLGGTTVDTLSLVDAAVFSASHGAKDSWSLLGQIVDHARLLRLVDWDAATEHAREARALRRWQIAGAMATVVDGHVRPVPPNALRRAQAMWAWLVTGQAPRGRPGAVATWRKFTSNAGTHDRVRDALARSRVLVWPVRSMAARELGDLGDRHPVLYPLATPLLLPKRMAAKFRP